MSDKQTDAELIAWLRSGLDNCDRDSEGLELGGVVMAMSVAADRIEALIRENTNLRQIERNVQAVREHEFKRAEAAKAKLAKAVEAAEFGLEMAKANNLPRTAEKIASVLAEIKGEN